MAISLRLSDDDAQIIKSYAKMHGISVSEFARRCMLERIEDEFDLADLRSAEKEWEKDPVTFSHEDAWAMIEDQ